MGQCDSCFCVFIGRVDLGELILAFVCLSALLYLLMLFLQPPPLPSRCTGSTSFESLPQGAPHLKPSETTGLQIIPNKMLIFRSESLQHVKVTCQSQEVAQLLSSPVAMLQMREVDKRNLKPVKSKFIKDKSVKRNYNRQQVLPLLQEKTWYEGSVSSNEG